MNMRVHISLPVTNLEASMNFYEKLFGQAASKVKDDYANFRLEQPSIHLALVQAGDDGGGHQARSASHFGVELPDADTFKAWHERLDSTGLSGREENDVICCYARAEKVWHSDPDGNDWEIWVRTGDAEQMHSELTKCCAA